MAKKGLAVQYYTPRGCFRKSVGKRRRQDGTLRERVWYFTNCSEQEAVARALALKAEWRRLKGTGAAEWPPEYVPPWVHRHNGPLASAARPMASAQGPAARTFREVRVGDLILDDALKLYRADLESHDAAGRISTARSRNAHAFAKRGVEFLGGATPLASVDRPRLVALVDFFCSRPKTKLGRPMAEESVRSHVSNNSTFFRWIAKNAHLSWPMPPNFDDIWTVGHLRPASEEERKAKYLERTGRGLRLFTVADLRTLYQTADVVVRAWMLVGLNCAFQNIDVSDLRTYEIHESGAHPRIVREREKTGVEGRWLLWPETLQAIRAAQASPNSRERVFLTPKGNPLVSRDNRSDFVSARWRALRRVADLPHAPPFKFIRKQSADTIKQLSGTDEISQVHRCHREAHGLSENYTNRLWERAGEWQLKMRESFRTLWEC